MNTVQKVKVNLPDGPATGEIVQIIETKEPFNEIHLEDGAILKLKTVALKVVRVDEKWDNEGNPVYAVTSSTVMSVENAPDHSIGRVN